MHIGGAWSRYDVSVGLFCATISIDGVTFFRCIVLHLTGRETTPSQHRAMGWKGVDRFQSLPDHCFWPIAYSMGLGKCINVIRITEADWDTESKCSVEWQSEAIIAKSVYYVSIEITNALQAPTIFFTAYVSRCLFVFHYIELQNIAGIFIDATQCHISVSFFCT